MYMLPLQIGLRMCVGDQFVRDTITKIKTAEQEPGGGPFPAGGMGVFKDQQRKEGDTQPYREEGIRDEQDMKGDAVVVERLEPARAIGIERIDKNMYEKLEAEKRGPVSRGHRAPGKKPSRAPDQQGRDHHYEKKGMRDPPMRPYIAGRGKPERRSEIDIRQVLSYCADQQGLFPQTAAGLQFADGGAKDDMRKGVHS